MSFGFSITDFISLISLAKKTCDDCRSASAHFGEAGRGAQSIHVILTQIKSEVENPESLLRRDKQCEKNLCTITKNCSLVLKQLDDIVVKYKSLGSSKKKPMDRFWFPRKEVLEIQGQLQFHESHLTAYLETLGFGALGRIEKKQETDRDMVLARIDLLGAELRSGRHQSSIMSDHAGDDKEFWKELRRRFISEGFTSQVMQKYEVDVMKRVLELRSYGLWESDALADTSSEDDGWFSDVYVQRAPYVQPEVHTDLDSETEGEANVTPKASQYDLRKQSMISKTPQGQPSSKSSCTTPSSTPIFSRPNLSRKASIEPMSSTTSNNTITSRQSRQYSWTASRSSIQIPPSYSSTPPANPQPAQRVPALHRSFTQTPLVTGMRIWSGRTGGLKLKARFVRKQAEFVVLKDTDEQEIMLPMSNLSFADHKFIQAEMERLPEVSKMDASKDGPSSPATRMKSSKETQNESQKEKVADAHDKVEFIDRGKHEISVGKRTHWKPLWRYRTLEFIPVRNGGYDCDSLPEAAQIGDFSRVQALLKKGANIESRGPAGSEENPKPPQETALYRAVANGHFDVAKLLLDNDANPEFHSMLQGAAESGKVEFVRLLLEYGARPQQHHGRTRSGSKRRGATTALHTSAANGYKKVVRLLLDYEADIDARDEKGQTPLYLAAWNGHPNTTKLLLEESADTEAVSNRGQTALYKASGNGNEEIVRSLLQYGASASLGHGIGGETALYKASRCGHIDVVRTLLDHGGDPKIANQVKNLPTGSKLNAIIWLLNPEEAARNHYGLWPLHAAAEQGRHQIASMLLEKGALVDAKIPDGETALYTAARKKHSNIVKLLLASGAEMARQEHIDPVMRLLEQQASRSVENGNQTSGPQRPLASAIGRYFTSFDEGGLEAKGPVLKGLGRMLGVAKENNAVTSGLEDTLGSMAEKYLEQAKSRFGLKA